MKSFPSFTLIEVLIAIAILSTGIVFIMSTFDASVIALSTSQDTLRMMRLARKKMTEVEMSALGEGGIEEETSSGTFSRTDSKFHWDLQVRRVTGPNDIPSAGETDSETLNEVVVTIGREGTGRRYSLATYVRMKR